MMKKLGGKSGAAAMKAMMGGGMPGMGGAGGMPDMEALSKGMGKMPNISGMPGGLMGGLPKGLPGLGGKSSGKKK